MFIVSGLLFPVYARFCDSAEACFFCRILLSLNTKTGFEKHETTNLKRETEIIRETQSPQGFPDFHHVFSTTRE